MKFIWTLLLVLVGAVSFGQTPEKEVEQVIYDIFDGMREGDTAKIASHFIPDATMKSVFFDEKGASIMRDGSLDGWLNGIMNSQGTVLDERLWDMEVRVDDNLAQAWTYYALYVNEEYHHCGVDAFQLFHDGEAWKVFHIADTRKFECDIPESVKNP